MLCSFQKQKGRKQTFGCTLKGFRPCRRHVKRCIQASARRADAARWCHARWCSFAGHVCAFGGFHGHGGTPKWMVYWLENPIYKWMITRGTPILGNLHFHMVPWKATEQKHHKPLDIFDSHRWNCHFKGRWWYLAAPSNTCQADVL